jgi:hypothetical protein
MENIEVYAEFVDKWFNKTNGLYGEGLEDLASDAERISHESHLEPIENQEFGYVIASILNKTQTRYLLNRLSKEKDNFSIHFAEGIFKNQEPLDKLRKRLDKYLRYY